MVHHEGEEEEVGYIYTKIGAMRTILIVILIISPLLSSSFFVTAVTTTVARNRNRKRGANGEISLTLAVPLTASDDGNQQQQQEQEEEEEQPPAQEVIKADPGWMHMASALMAIDHFNERNPIVVKELQNDPLLARDCPFKLVNITVVDTGTQSHKAMKTLMETIMLGNEEPPDAIAGPYNDQPALELSVLATGMEVPMVAFRGLDQNLVLPAKHPYFTQIYPDLYGEMDFIGKFLEYTGRTNYIALLHSDDDAILQRIQVLKPILQTTTQQQNADDDNNTAKFVKDYSYLSLEKATTTQGEAEAGDAGDEYRGIEAAVEQISQTGYRTILVFLTTPYEDVQLIGKAAHQYGLDEGKHFWIFMGGLDPSSSSEKRDQLLREFRNLPQGRFFRGAAYLYIFDDQYLRKNSPFQTSLRQQNTTFLQRLVELNPISNYYTTEFCHDNNSNDTTTTPTTTTDSCNPKDFPHDDVFRIPELAERIGFAYDATMSIGIGACLALQQQQQIMAANSTQTTNTTIAAGAGITGFQHLQGIRSVNFGGVTGRVRFHNRPGTPGSRDGSSIYFGVLNIDPPVDHNYPNLVEGTSYLDPFTHEWVEMIPFIYADGTTNPPLPLRSTPEQNYLDPTIRAIGLALMSVALFKIFVSLVWILWNRGHRVVIAAQPPFLYVLCLGATLTSLVILTQSFDESYGWDESMLDKACLAMPWLVCLGIMVTYSALFTKLWRVNKVLQFRRAQIKMSHVVAPALFLFLLTVVLLSVWTATTDFGWVREEIDEVTGETMGRCKGTDLKKFFFVIDAIVFLPMVLTGVMAFKTRDVDDIYSESRWIFSMIMIQLQVGLVAVPTTMVLMDISTMGRYIGLVLIVWTFPMSTMGLMMLPKMLAVRRSKLGADAHPHGKRGSTEGVRVTGLNHNDTEPASHDHTSAALSSRTHPPCCINSNSTYTGKKGSDSAKVQMVTMQ